jgi:hypothetical protein
VRPVAPAKSGSFRLNSARRRFSTPKLMPENHVASETAVQ